MLCLYFLKRFYKNFLFFFLVLTFVFAFSDLFVRLPIISSLKAVPKLIFLMLPLMSQFAIPIASVLSVQMVVGNLYVEDEILFFYFFSSARKLLHFAVLIFSLSILAFYTPLIFVWAPQSYKKGKEFILKFAKDQFYQLEPGKFHFPFPRFSFFFKNKKIFEEKLIFEKILLMFTEKDGSRYLVNAQSGYLLDDTLCLENGVIQNLAAKQHYSANFAQTDIYLKRFFGCDKEDKNESILKFCSQSRLASIKKTNSKAFIEYHKRIVQILWQLLFPFLALWGIMIFGRQKSNLLFSIGWGGALFLFSYLCLNMAQMMQGTIWLALFFLYAAVILFSLIVYFIYKKRK